MSGFITIERDMWDHPVLTRSEMSETEAWAWMIARASWSGTTHMVGDNLVEVERGSFMVTLRRLQSEFMWKSDKRVRNFLKKLENHGMLAVQTMGQRNARKTHVTICKYEQYQSGGRSKDAAKTHHGRTADAVKEQGNKVTKKDTDVSLQKPPKRKSRIREDAQITGAMVAYAADPKRGHSLQEAEAQFQKFKNNALAKGLTYVDWDRAFLTWLDSPYFKPITTGVQNGKPRNSDGSGAAMAQRGADRAVARLMDFRTGANPS